jgi:hypothetical protein
MKHRFPIFQDHAITGKPRLTRMHLRAIGSFLQERAVEWVYSKDCQWIKAALSH